MQTNSPTLDGHYNVDIYYLLSESHYSTLPISFEHIDSTPGWKTFDITPIVIKWKQGLVNHGLQLRLTKGEEILSCEEVFSKGEEDLNTEPLLIVYANDHNTPKTSLKRDITPQHQETRSAAVVTGCHRKRMVAKIESLIIDGMHVIHPSFVDVGVCSGLCSYSYLQGNQLEYANILYSHDLNGEESSALISACCVPTSFRNILVMAYDEASKILHLKKAAILVHECACL